MNSRPRGLAAGAARAALVPGAAVVVHQLRFLLAFGRGSGVVLAQTGHAYLHSLVPWIVALLGVAVGGFLRGFGRALSGQRSARRYTLSLTALWLVCAACLLAVYVTQELLEGLLASGHATGLAGVFGYGGWWSIPAAGAVGLVLAAVFHGARWALERVASRRAAPARVWELRVPAPRRPHAIAAPCPVPLAGGWSDRGPPRLVAHA